MPDLPPLLERMEQFGDARRTTRDISEWVYEIHFDLHTLQWIAAGGRGTADRESVIENIDSQIANLEHLREQVEELDDPREIREETKALIEEGDDA